MQIEKAESAVKKFLLLLLFCTIDDCSSRIVADPATAPLLIVYAIAAAVLYSQDVFLVQVGTSGDGDAGESVDEEAVEVSEDTGPLNLDEATAAKEEEETLMGTRARPMQRAALEVYGGGAGGVAQRINENLVILILSYLTYFFLQIFFRCKNSNNFKTKVQ